MRRVTDRQKTDRRHAYKESTKLRLHFSILPNDRCWVQAYQWSRANAMRGGPINEKNMPRSTRRCHRRQYFVRKPDAKCWRARRDSNS